MYNQQLIKISQNEYLDRDYYIENEEGTIVKAGIGTSLEGDAFEPGKERDNIFQIYPGTYV